MIQIMHIFADKIYQKII